jgi:hypothetical protein
MFRKVHPLTWIVSAALMPVLVWDVWQTLHDIKQHHAFALSAAAAVVPARGPFE